ncbi:metal-binding protein [Phormidesmis priestleyi]|uniref:metal-binding protein n=1 Tax=Phormidesmis priestleyi TaxID=268141 RepID=UPI00083A820D|nr:metal-binding protein [Phormidesmis priestleyi]
MPSGRTHDSITLWSLPLVTGGAFALTQSGNLTLVVSGAFLVGGLMFGPDLDIYSQQYKRWGFLRWIWLPYRKSMRHRSFFSHGLMIGTIVRILYLIVWVAIGGSILILSGAIVQQLLGTIDHWQILAQQRFETSIGMIRQSLQQHSGEWIAGTIGLELGSLSHSISDWLVSAYKKKMKKLGKKRAKG